MEKIIEVYKGLSFLFTQTKLTVLSIEQCFLNSQQLDNIKFNEEFYNQNTYSTSIRALLSNYALIQFCSFLEEYKRFNKSISEDDIIIQRVIKVRSKNSYGIERINEWKDLENMRNQLLARNFQIKKKSFFDNDDDLIFEYNIPDTLNEKLVFIKIMEKICQNIFQEFPEILHLSNIESYKMSENLIISKNIIDLKKELNLINENM